MSGAWCCTARPCGSMSRLSSQRRVSLMHRRITGWLLARVRGTGHRPGCAGRQGARLCDRHGRGLARGRGMVRTPQCARRGYAARQVAGLARGEPDRVAARGAGRASAQFAGGQLGEPFGRAIVGKLERAGEPAAACGSLARPSGRPRTWTCVASIRSSMQAAPRAPHRATSRRCAPRRHHRRRCRRLPPIAAAAAVPVPVPVLAPVPARMPAICAISAASIASMCSPSPRPPAPSTPESARGAEAQLVERS